MMPSTPLGEGNRTVNLLKMTPSPHLQLPTILGDYFAQGKSLFPNHPPPVSHSEKERETQRKNWEILPGAEGSGAPGFPGLVENGATTAEKAARFRWRQELISTRQSQEGEKHRTVSPARLLPPQPGSQLAGVIRTLSMCRRLSFRALAGGTEVPEPRGGPLPAAMSRLSQGFPITRSGRSRSRRSPPPPRWAPVPLDALERFAFRRRQPTQRREAALTGSPSPTRVLRGGAGAATAFLVSGIPRQPPQQSSCPSSRGENPLARAKTGKGRATTTNAHPS